MPANPLMNRLGNSGNIFQGKYKRVLCVCSAGLLRSPTVALVLSQEPYNFNTRAAGVNEEFALIPVDKVLLRWADQIVTMDDRQAELIRNMMEEGDDTPIVVLNIPDVFEYRDPELIELIRERYDEAASGVM